MTNDYIDFSVIDSELKAYLIGFFYADATLSDYVITVRLSIKDKEHLEKLANILGKPTFTRNVKNKNDKVYKSIGFNICSKQSIDSLRKIGFIKNKTYQIDDIVFNNIPDNLKRHFLRSKNFKTEIEAQNFLQDIKNKNKIIKTYEKFISKMVK